MKIYVESDIVWTITLIAALVITASPYSRAQWETNGTAVCEMVNAQRPPRVVTDGAGGVIIVWKGFRYGDWDVYMQRVDQTGVPLWTDGGAPVCTMRRAQHWISLVPDGSGGAVAVWMDMRRQWDIYGQRIDADGTTLWKSNGNAICIEPGQKTCLVSARAGPDQTIVAWVDMRNEEKELFAQRVSDDGKIFWGREGKAVCMKSGFQWNPNIIPDGDGGVIVAWQDMRDGTWDIYAQKVNELGEPQWDDIGIRVCSLPEGQFFPVLASDGAGGAIVAWHTMQKDDRDVFVQRINAAGDVEWAKEGIAVSPGSGSGQKPRIVSDGVGGAIVVWVEGRKGSRDIYAQRIDSTGDIRWIAGGIGICTFAEDQWAPEILHDGDTGVIIAWHDMRNDYRDIYTQKVAMDGAVQWALDGVAICTEVEPQVDPQLATDGDGGAIVVWLDLRKDDYTADIYAERIDRYGILGHEGGGTEKQKPE